MKLYNPLFKKLFYILSITLIIKLYIQSSNGAEVEHTYSSCKNQTLAQIIDKYEEQIRRSSQYCTLFSTEYTYSLKYLKQDASDTRYLSLAMRDFSIQVAAIALFGGEKLLLETTGFVKPIVAFGRTYAKGKFISEIPDLSEFILLVDTLYSYRYGYSLINGYSPIENTKTFDNINSSNAKKINTLFDNLAIAFEQQDKKKIQMITEALSRALQTELKNMETRRNFIDDLANKYMSSDESALAYGVMNALTFGSHEKEYIDRIAISDEAMKKHHCVTKIIASNLVKKLSALCATADQIR